MNQIFGSALIRMMQGPKQWSLFFSPMNSPIWCYSAIEEKRGYYLCSGLNQRKPTNRGRSPEWMNEAKNASQPCFALLGSIDLALNGKIIVLKPCKAWHGKQRLSIVLGCCKNAECHFISALCSFPLPELPKNYGSAPLKRFMAASFALLNFSSEWEHFWSFIRLADKAFSRFLAMSVLTWAHPK